MAELDRGGEFRARPIKSRLRQTESGAVSWNALFDIEAWWNGKAWEECAADGYQIWGDVWLVQTAAKGGGPSEKGWEQLRAALGWSGSFASLDGDFSGTTVNIVVREEQSPKYGKQLKVQWLYPARTNPSAAGGTVNVKALDAKFGALARAKLAKLPKPDVPVPATPAPIPAQGADLSIPEENIPF